tara:strand:- start:161056 stop:161475 length:420 start_codon:yes stop_codon:yes gene_type:complete
MKFTAKQCVFVAVIAVIAGVGSANDADAGNGWRWSKPLNQKPGSAFYTSNLKNHQRTTTRRKSVHASYVSPRPYVQPRVASPAVYPHMIVQPPSVAVNPVVASPIETHPTAGGQIIQTPALSVPTPTRMPSQLDAWMAH